MALYQTSIQPPKTKILNSSEALKIRLIIDSNLFETNKKGGKELSLRGLISYEFMLGRPSLPGYHELL